MYLHMYMYIYIHIYVCVYTYISIVCHKTTININQHQPISTSIGWSLGPLRESPPDVFSNSCWPPRTYKSPCHRLPPTPGSQMRWWGDLDDLELDQILVVMNCTISSFPETSKLPQIALKFLDVLICSMAGKSMLMSARNLHRWILHHGWTKRRPKKNMGNLVGVWVTWDDDISNEPVYK